MVRSDETFRRTCHTTLAEPDHGLYPHIDVRLFWTNGCKYSNYTSCIEVWTTTSSIVRYLQIISILSFESPTVGIKTWAQVMALAITPTAKSQLGSPSNTAYPVQQTLSAWQDWGLASLW